MKHCGKLVKPLLIKNWEPQLNECSEGKFHACSFSLLCDDFRNEKDDKYIAIRIKVKIYTVGRILNILIKFPFGREKFYASVISSGIKRLKS